MESRLPFREGLATGKGEFPVEPLPAVESRLSLAANLADLADELAFYSPALLYLYVRLNGREPFFDFLAEYGRPLTPVVLGFRRPVFSGLTRNAAVDWNHTLLALPQKPFEAFKNWLGTLAFVDRDHGNFSRVRYVDLPVVDPLWLDKQVTLPDVLPRVRVTCFCLDTSAGCHYFEAPTVETDPPRYRYSPLAFDDTAMFGRAVLAESEHPYACVPISTTNGLPSYLVQHLQEAVSRQQKRE